MKTPDLVELLEPRIAPASVFTFTDIDGDRVKIISNVGDLNAPGVVTTLPGGFVGGEQLTLLDLRDPSFQGAVITTKVTKAQGGDGFVHIGRIDATGRDLGQVKIKGDLGAIDVGDSDTSSPALKLLDVRSMGRFGFVTQGGIGDLTSDIQGDLRKLKIAGDLREARIFVGQGGSIGSITIGGSIIGGLTDLSGYISASGDIGSVKVGRDIIGGHGPVSGAFSAGEKLGLVTIGGSIVGGSGAGSGTISGFDLGTVTIGGDLIGGDGEESGSLFAGGQFGALKIRGSVIGDGIASGVIAAVGRLGAVKIGGSLVGGDGATSGKILAEGIARMTIGGSIIGGPGNESGSIFIINDIGPLKIGQNLRGGSISFDEPTLESSGYIQAGRIASITIGGSIIAGSDNSTAGALINNASIRVNNDIGPIVVKGSISGSETPNGLTQVVIAARGQEVLPPGARSDLAIKSVTVGGHVELAKILGGFRVNDFDDAGSNGNASIGPVKVGGDWHASTISAGVHDRGMGGFGDGGDTVINNATDAIIARIASIKIKGTVTGAFSPFFPNAFIAQQIGSFKAGAFTAPLTSGTDAPIFVTPYMGNILIVEV